MLEPSTLMAFSLELGFTMVVFMLTIRARARVTLIAFMLRFVNV